MTTEFKKIVFVIALILCAPLSVYADWQPSDGHKMHFPQLPNPMGWDIDLRPFELADDWQCSKTGDVNDIHFWISWQGDVNGTIPNIQVKIYSNDPNPPYSKPATQLWSRTFADYEFTIRLIDPNGHQGYWIPTGPNSPPTLYPNDHNSFYQVNIKNIQNAFPQVEGQIYWLSLRITTTTPSTSRVGWKTSLNHFMDAAVVRYTPGPVWKPLYEPNMTIPIDFAFVITGGPNEPTYPTDAKWLQKPDLSNNGLDVKASDPYLILADDFECNKSTLITDITVWGSWRNDILPPNGANDVWFTLSIHSDIPASQSPSGYSMPNEVLWYRNLMASEVSIQRQDINEGWWDPYYGEYLTIGDHVCWKYVFHIPEANAFCQKGEPNKPIVYWLDVQAHPNGPISEAQFGWKSSINHWNDDAAWAPGSEPYIGWWNELRYPIGHPLEPCSIDLAFAIEGNIPCVQLPEHDLGDAPDSSNNFGAIMTAYPSGVVANYPTVYLDPTGSPPFGPIHQQPQAVAWLGPYVSLENEADLLPDQDTITNIDPLSNSPDRDANDDGVLGIPLKLPYCYPKTFQYRVNVVNNTVNLYVNAWFDWNRDGDWDDTFTCGGTNNAPEWAVQNQLLPAGSLVIGLNTITTPQFRAWHPSPIPTDANIWMRITLSEKPWVSGGGLVGDGGSGPATGYLYGETEDYYFRQVTGCMKPNLTDMNEYNAWVQFGEPNCWCFKRQCRGDANNAKLGAYWVASNDLNLLRRALNRNDACLATITYSGVYGICADADHKKTGAYRVASTDLNILRKYLNQSEVNVPCCDYNAPGTAPDCNIDCNMPPVGDRWYFWMN